MAPSDTDVDDPADFRLRVVAESIRLFAENGYETTTVDQVAAAAGISRRTFFRQFGSKEDVIFADHEALFTQVAAHLETSADDDPWSVPCTAAEIVFTHFLTTRDLAVRRLRVVQEVPALRDRELVTTYRYQRMFEEYLRTRLPGETPAHLAGYAGAVTAAHNYVLRAMIRGDAKATLATLRAELNRVRLALGARAGVSSGTDAGNGPSEQVITVVTYPVGTDPDVVARRVEEQLRAESGKRAQ